MRRVLVFLMCVFLGFSGRAMPIINDTEIESVVGELIAPLASAANIAPSRLRLHIVHDDSFNAFVMGGEDIYIYTGLLTRIRTPNALRAVVAHELGHTIGGHTAQMSARMESEMIRTLLIQALGVGLVAAGGNPSLGAGVVAGAGGIARQSMLAFSRDEERMADDMGVGLMVRSGFNPNGFIDVFNQMSEMTSAMESRVNPNAINHPLTMERIKNVRDKLTTDDIRHKKFKTDSPEIIKKYDLVRAKLVGYLDGFDRVRTLYPVSDKSDAAIYARAIANIRSGNLSGATVGARTLISRNPNNSYFYELLGDIEYKHGHYDDAIDVYSRAIQLNPNSPQVETALAMVLTERGRPDDITDAIRLLKHVILISPTPLAYWTLSRAYGADDGRSDWAMAEFYNAGNDKKRAREYARRAKSHLPKNSPEYIKSDDLLKD